MEIDWRGLYFPGTPPKDTGEVVGGMPGLVTADPRPPGMKGAGNGKWLLEADEGGIGGEKGWPGCWLEGLRLVFEVTGEMDGSGAGSSSWLDTPRARNFASLSSLT